MICKQCGSEISPEAKFCGVCGAPNEAPASVQEPAQPAEPVYAQPAEPVYAQPAEPVYAQPVQQQPVQQQPAQPQYAQPVQPQYAQPQYAPQPQYGQPQYVAPMPEDPVERGLSKSVLIFGILAISFAFIPYINFIGIIFGAITLSKAKKYVASGYVLTGRAKVGKILGTVGLIAAIVFTVIFTIIIIVAIIAAVSYSNSNYYYYY